ncbi:hypothetical protein AB6D11_00420 [Vibrio splendidus]
MNWLPFSVRFFFLPLMILRFATENGFSESVFTVIGIVLGLITLLAMTSRIMNGLGLASEKMMVGGHACVALSVIVMSYISENMASSWFQMFAFMTAFAFFDVFSKVWTVGYQDVFQRASGQYHQANLRLSNLFKSSSAAFGFLLMFTLGDLPYFWVAIVTLSCSVIVILFHSVSRGITCTPSESEL